MYALIILLKRVDWKMVKMVRNDRQRDYRKQQLKVNVCALK